MSQATPPTRPVPRSRAGATSVPAEARADALARLDGRLVRLGGSEAQSEVVEETRTHALLRAGRYDDARLLLDIRLDRWRCRRDEWWQAAGQPRAASAQALEI